MSHERTLQCPFLAKYLPEQSFLSETYCLGLCASLPASLLVCRQESRALFSFMINGKP